MTRILMLLQIAFFFTYGAFSGKAFIDAYDLGVTEARTAVMVEFITEMPINQLTEFRI